MDDQQKLDRMQAEIDALRAKTEPKPAVVTQDSANMSVGVRAGTELVGAIGGAGLIGWGLDQWLETAPWLLIVMLVLGVGAGFMNVYKTTQSMGTGVGSAGGQKKTPQG